jgi:predicted DNA-binding transcriptional regulator YafY
LTDKTFSLPAVRISRREAFSFALARKLLAQYEATPLHMDMRAVSDKIAESLEGDISMEPDCAERACRGAARRPRADRRPAMRGKSSGSPVV